MAGTIKTLIVLIILGIPDIESAKILAYFPTPAISHQVVFRPLIHTLAKRGHEVIVITTDPAFQKGEAPDTLTEIDVHDISYQVVQEVLIHHNGDKQNIMQQVNLLIEKFSIMVELQLNSTDVKDMLRDKDKNYFDLLILEAWNRPILGLIHLFDAPVIQFSSFGGVTIQYASFGAPMHPLLYPTAGRQRLYNLTLLEKATEFLKYLVLEHIIVSTEEYDNNMIKRSFGDDVPRIDELATKVNLLLLNEHPLWADNHPVPPNIVYIGGIHQPLNQELPEDLKKYLNSSKHGVIYVSFGTNVLPSVLPRKQIQKMTKVLSELHYDVLWKWDTSELPGQSKNIKTDTWFPQADLLKHPKIKLFITQCGLQSTDEAIDAAVPVVGIPILGDQWYNAEKYVHYKIGVQLDMTKFTEEEFKDAVKAVTEDKIFKDNIIKLRNILRDHPISPLDTAVWWTEHIIKYGGDHLRSPAAGLSWTEYYEVKLVLIVLSILFLILIPLVLILKKICNLVYNFCAIKLKVKVN